MSFGGELYFRPQLGPGKAIVKDEIYQNQREAGRTVCNCHEKDGGNLEQESRMNLR